MKKRVTRSRFSLLIVFAAASVFTASAGGDENPRVIYQNQLLGGNLSAPDVKLCNERVGERSEANAATYDQCKVTRLFVADLLDQKTVPGAPPMFKAAYVNKTEIPMVADVIKRK
ncbi:MAG: hypothetical protein HY923_08430 [Elusimicrobia bacterium]|nr:hypothetical protein [Elusimicrobiota bacterium]